jgi:hypothetical protein
MIFDNPLLIGFGIFITGYMLYKYLFKSSKFNQEYDTMYEKVLNSEEYKVKGQFDK